MVNFSVPTVFSPVSSVPNTRLHGLVDADKIQFGGCRDTYFGALMLSHDRQGSTMGLAVSSLIQVTKAKTLGPYLDGHGFVPGYSKGCARCVS